jgi:hypothetical protein
MTVLTKFSSKLLTCSLDGTHPSLKQRINILFDSRCSVTKCFNEPRTWTDSLGRRPKLWNDPSASVKRDILEDLNAKWPYTSKYGYQEVKVNVYPV